MSHAVVWNTDQEESVMADVKDHSEHWNHIYRSRSESEMSWYQPHLQLSLDIILRTGASRTASIIDVGGGSSTLADDLLNIGFTNITVLDLSPSALDKSRRRLGQRAGRVNWVLGDVTTIEFEPDAYDVWHDRAVFHFLTEERQRRRYVQQVCRSVRVGGHVIVAAFGPEGPERCSGLPVVRYSDRQLHAEFGGAFTLIESVIEEHHTPWGAEQEFVYCSCRKTHPC